MVDKRGHRYVQQRIEVSVTDLELISALLRASGAGNVIYRKGRYTNLAKVPAKPTDMWRWYVTAYHGVVSLAQQVTPFSSKAQRLLAELDETVYPLKD